MYGYVYQTINLINGKKYIGKHKSNVFDESYKGSGVYLSRAIKKYGWENFKCELIQCCDSKEQLNNAEVYYIQKYDAVKDNNYYNVATGGEGGDTFSGMPEHLSTIRRRKISAALSGRKKSEEHIQNIKNSLHKNGSHVGKKNSMYGVDRSGEKAPNYGRHYYNNGTEEYLLYEEVYESEYKHRGFIKGRLQWKLDALHKDLSKRLAGNTYTKGKIRIHKDNVETLIYPEQLESYIAEGWLKGRRPKQID